MGAVRRILVAVKEPQARSQPAILKAAQLARAWKADLHLFHAHTAPLIADAYAVDLSFKDQKRRVERFMAARLEVLADQLRRHGLVVTASAEWDFPTHEAIVRAARRAKAELIVAQCHAGRHRLPWLMRLTDWELVRLSPVPLLLIKNRSGYRHPAILAALDPSHAMDKPASLDRVIMEFAGAINAALRGRLHAVHAYSSYPMAPLMPEGVAVADIDAIEKQVRRVAAQRFKRSLRASGLPLTQRHLVPGHPIDAIATTARKARSAIVVMGAVSRSGLRNLLIGNTAERILEELGCDILVVKPKRFRNRVSRAVRGARLMAPPAAMLT
jgi:universal stress protein E